MYNLQLIEDNASLKHFLYRQDLEQDLSDLQESQNQEIDEKLQDGELTQIASEAIGELFSTPDTNGIDKVMEALTKAIMLGGDYTKVTVASLLSNLSTEDEEIVKSYVYENGL